MDTIREHISLNLWYFRYSLRSRIKRMFRKKSKKNEMPPQIIILPRADGCNLQRFNTTGYTKFN